MLDSVMQNVGGMNVQVPVGYVLMAVAGLAATWWTISKAFMLAKMLVIGVLARFSIAMLGSGALFLGGIAGLGNSTGNLLDGATQPKQESVSFIDKETANSIAKSSNQPIEARKMAFDYAKDQDRKLNNQVVKAETTYVSTQTEAPKSYDKVENKSFSWTVFSTSIGMMLVGVVWMLRRWDEVGTGK